MILYFTGTGNSRFVAEAIGSYLEDPDIIDLVPHIQSKRHKRFYSYVPYVVVAPIYAWRYPRIVESFIEKSDFWGDNYFYFVATCESQTGNAAKYLKDICDRKRYNYCGFAGVPMPENYTVMYNAPDEHECKVIINKSLDEIEKIAANIKNGERIHDSLDMGPVKGFTAVMNPAFYSGLVSSKKFYATDKCIGCGRCERVCPFGSIRLVDRKPQWSRKCTHCMACINGCPTKAIEFGKATVGRRRYFNDLQVVYERDGFK